MTRTVVGFLGLLVLLPALQAQDKPGTPTPAQQYQALVKEYRTAFEEYRKAMSDAKTREERQKVFEEKDPHPDKFAPHFLELAEKHPKDPAAVDALIWLAAHYTDKRDPQSPRSKALQILLRDHVQNEKMTALFPALGRVGLGYARDKESQQLLHAVLEKNKHRPAQAFACLALAEQAEGCLRASRELKDDPKQWTSFYKQRFGKDVVEALIKADPDKLSKEAESFYERIIKDFADVVDRRGNKLGEEAKQELDKLRHPILVGKPAPEIEGEDIKGVKFKLSDYRGKVVLLDFWGNWCPHCRAMYPHERSLVKRLEGKPFALIGVNSDKDRAELKKVLVKEKITWRSFWNGQLGPISGRWDVHFWPVLFLIDAKGVLRYKHFGSPGEKILDDEIDKLIAEVEKSAAK